MHDVVVRRGKVSKAALGVLLPTGTYFTRPGRSVGKVLFFFFSSVRFLIGPMRV